MGYSPWGRKESDTTERYMGIWVWVIVPFRKIHVLFSWKTRHKDEHWNTGTFFIVTVN